MQDSKEKLRILDCKATDNAYLHKDFHGALCYGIKYLDDRYGHEATRDYLRQVGQSYYAPLSNRLKSEGLTALEKHWHEVFSKEGGRFNIKYLDGVLVLTIHECPAIAYLKQANQLFTHRYCETTVVINETVCDQAGYACSTEYEPGAGRCVQKFWKVKE